MKATIFHSKNKFSTVPNFAHNFRSPKTLHSLIEVKNHCLMVVMNAISPLISDSIYGLLAKNNNLVSFCLLELL